MIQMVQHKKIDFFLIYEIRSKIVIIGGGAQFFF